MKIINLIDMNKIRYDYIMNIQRYSCDKNVFGSLKNRWKILRHFNSRVDRITKVIVACCVLHNLYEIWNQD
jgi:hypothetical protein